MTRRKMIAGNWKMNNLKEDVIQFFKELGDYPSNFKDRDIVIAPSIPYLLLSGEKRDKSVKLAVQDIYPETKGAFTGQVGSEMLKDLDAEFVIIGHSERRHIMNESLEMIRKKVTFSQQEGFKIIYCVGETLSQRQKNELFAVIEKQLSDAFDNNLNISEENLIIAYEPVWAIGTGLTPTLEDISKIHLELKEKSKAPLLYGGSVKVDTAKDILACDGVDGVLVGSGALAVENFCKMIELAQIVDK